MSVIAIKLKRYVKKLFILVLLCYIMFLIVETQEMCEKAVSRESFMLKYCSIDPGSVWQSS